MEIKIISKSLNKTRGIEPKIYQVDDNIKTLKDLIENLVDIEIEKYENDNFKILTQDDMNEMMNSGKISFGFKYREEFNENLGTKIKKINREESKEIAYLAFEDGLYVVFIGKEKIEKLDEIINLKTNDEITLIKLTMLAGRWF